MTAERRGFGTGLRSDIYVLFGRNLEIYRAQWPLLKVLLWIFPGFPGMGQKVKPTRFGAFSGFCQNLSKGMRLKPLLDSRDLEEFRILWELRCFRDLSVRLSLENHEV